MQSRIRYALAFLPLFLSACASRHAAAPSLEPAAPAPAPAPAAAQRSWLGRTADSAGDTAVAPFRWLGTHFTPPAVAPATRPAPTPTAPPQAVLIPRYSSSPPEPAALPTSQPSTQP